MLDDTLIPFLADGLMLGMVPLAIWLLLFRIRGPWFASYSRILMAGLTAYVAAKLIGVVFQPEGLRPFEQLGVEAGASFLNNPGFPSDHMLLAVTLVYAVWFETGRKGWAALLTVFALLIGLGRILALVHTPLDVIGAVLIATIGVPWYLQGRYKAQAVNKNRKKSKKDV